MSKVIRIHFDFALLGLAVGFKNSCHFLNQLEVKPKPITSKTKTDRDLLAQVSRASCRLNVIAWSCDWTMDCCTFSVIGHSNYFGFGVITLENLTIKLYQIKMGYD